MESLLLTLKYFFYFNIFDIFLNIFLCDLNGPQLLQKCCCQVCQPVQLMSWRPESHVHTWSTGSSSSQHFKLIISIHFTINRAASSSSSSPLMLSRTVGSRQTFVILRLLCFKLKHFNRFSYQLASEGRAQVYFNF